MARKGENIYKRKDGRWEGRWIDHYDEYGKAHYRSVYAHTYTEVREKLHQCRRQETDTNSTSNRKTLQVYCEEWLAAVKLKHKASTYCKYEAICRKHIIPALGSYPISKISTVQIEQFLTKKLFHEDLSPSTVKGYLCVLKLIFAYANQIGCQTVCSFAGLSVQQKQRSMRVLSKEEQKLLSDFLCRDMNTVKLGIYLSLYTGIRIGELCALQWKHISFEEKTLHVTATMQRITVNELGAKTKVIITPPKSVCSNRMIPLTDSLLRLLREYKCSEEAYLLTGKTEQFMEPRALQYHFKKCMRGCGLDDVNFHALRHTFATRCAEAGFEMRTLSEILGHSSVNITLNRYVHSSMETKRSNMEKLETIF